MLIEPILWSAKMIFNDSRREPMPDKEDCCCRNKFLVITWELIIFRSVLTSSHCQYYSGGVLQYSSPQDPLLLLRDNQSILNKNQLVCLCLD